MKKNHNRQHINERLEHLHACNWYSQLNQARYWTGSPWRAFGEMFH